MKQARRFAARPCAGAVAGVLGLGLCALAAEATASPYPLDQFLPEDAAAKLQAAGIKSSDDLLAKGATRADRAKLAKANQLPLPQLTEWVRQSDLLRLKGVGPIMVKLLLAAKVDGVPKLKGQKIKTFYPKLMKVNDKLKITENPPSEQYVSDWIDQAKKLPPLMK